MCLFATLAIYTFAAELGFAQDHPKTLELVVGNYAIEPARDGEVLLLDAKMRDAEFDDSITKESKWPDRLLSDDEMKHLTEQLKAGKFETDVEDQVDGDETNVASVDQLMARTDLSEANLYIKFYKASEWKSDVSICCPRKESYQCSISTRIQYLPCQFKEPYGWCCPLHPVAIRMCNCKKCFKLCEDCVHEGQCLARYSYQSYLAVCWNLRWHTSAYFKVYLPSSCYCNAEVC